MKLHWRDSENLRGVLLIMLCLWPIWVFAQENHQLRIIDEAGSKIAELDVFKSMSNSRTLITPRQTIMKYIRSIAVTDIEGLLETYDSARLQGILSGRSKEQVIAEMTDKDWPTFSDVTVDSFDYLEDDGNIRITAIVSSVRDRIKITEQFSLYLVDTPEGWKIKEDQVMSIQRKRLP